MKTLSKWEHFTKLLAQFIRRSIRRSIRRITLIEDSPNRLHRNSRHAPPAPVRGQHTLVHQEHAQQEFGGDARHRQESTKGAHVRRRVGGRG